MALKCTIKDKPIRLPRRDTQTATDTDVAFHLQSVITITFELQSKTIAIVLLFYRFANKFSVYKIR